ncbi:S-methyl-5-thioribose-1-phosphate isomerase [Streptomyces sp. NRRL S-87]|uniref:S-methyl-5-thioribose-1-phosphate isomerase n=1 Tax=Streptomyces sp. NRRL S-87 TaxID=1463920 RepID=UPI0004BF2FE7|nr:S-methyl-5-thioribose-1-phosphate isomerase [Streptomyces sp. NRRL S-87]
MKASIRWEDGAILTTDQRALPHEHRPLRLSTVDEVIEAVQSLAVRGAPAIGLVGALGVALSAHAHQHGGAGDGVDEPAVRADAERLAKARPTAVNLAWAVHRVLGHLPQGPRAVLDAALEMISEDVAVNRAMVARAAELVESLTPDRPLRILTHCNTGRFATGAVGTALGTIVELAARGRVLEVLADETRPLLQGSRLTAWELGEAGVPYRLCVDAAAAAAMAQGLVDCVLVGADRIAANGDTANKIGTYGLAVAAARHGIPFVVVAPEATRDPDLADGGGIVIEERPAAEVTSLAGRATAPADAGVYNPAFDVTPAELITAVVTEREVFRPGAAGAEPGDEAPARELATFSRVLYERGWMPGTSGNLSVRTPRVPGSARDRALITASGLDKGGLTERDMVPIDAGTGAPLAPGPLRASAEAAIHAAVYRATGAGAVIHVHSPYATAAAVLAGVPEQGPAEQGRAEQGRAGHGPAEQHRAEHGPAELVLERYELLKGLGLDDPSRTALPVFANDPDVTRIAARVHDHLADRPGAAPALLITDHGVTVWGRDLAQARNRLECVEAICRLHLLVGPTPPAPRTAVPHPTGATS